MAGIYLPLDADGAPVSRDRGHVPEIYNREQEFPHVMDPGGESYLRQEGRGLCIGFYEQACDPGRSTARLGISGMSLLE